MANNQPINGQNIGNGANNDKPTIPEEVGEPNCSICLSRVENRAYTNTCLHEFCFPCIKEWSKSHNTCPICREVYRKILHNIRSKTDYDEEEVAEPPDMTHGMLLILGDMALLLTPPNSGLYVINPQQTTHGMRYTVEYYGPNLRVILPFFNPNLIIVSPDRLEETLQEMNISPHHPHHGSHPRWLRHHRHHR